MNECNGYLPEELTNTITGERLKRCKHCKAAEDSARIMKVECPTGRHSFTEDYESPLQHRG